MFDVGFQELALIFGVSLIVLGPKRLPGLVTKVGRWVGKARVMARDFRQQLEAEVNLEELNKMTEMQSRGSTMPSPPPEFTGEPPPETTPTYPYSTPEASAGEVSAAEISPLEEHPELPQTDDTYSHAHAAGDAPMPDVLPHDDAPVAHDQEPVQADLDLSSPEDNSHLPPDDARRYS
jgi:sec-independent protein translocase protein TatB